MGLFNSIRLGASGAGGDYEIDRSLRCDPGSTAYLEATPSAAGSNQMTFSFWMKRGNLGAGAIFSSGTTNARGHIYFSSDKLAIQPFNSSGANAYLITDMVFRDSNAWYHVVISFNNTAYNDMSSTVNIYVNGVAVTFTTSATGTPTGGNRLNDSQEKRIGEMRPDSGSHFDGYLAEFNFIDGQVLDASSFGKTNALTGQWIPKKYAGTYGTEGFYLNFSDNSGTTATTLGKDTSGQSNNWTPYNFGTGDSVKDSPTNNFCTLLTLQKTAATTFSEGNLKGTNNYAHKTLYGTFGLRSGKWYWEAEATSGSATKWTYGVSDIENTKNTQISGQNYLLAVSSGSPSNATYAYGDAVSIYNSKLYKNGSVVTTSYQTNPSAGDIIGVALDVDAGKVWFSRNGTWINGSATASTTLDESNHDTTVATGKVYTPAYSVENVGWCVNFGQDSSFANAKTAQGNTDGNGQGDFYYAVPSGFKAICNANLPDPAIALPNKHFDTLTWTGTSASHTLTGLNFQPDWFWAKARSVAYHHTLIDSLRGTNKQLWSNRTNAEQTNTSFLTSFNSNGVTLGDNSSGTGATNTNGHTYVGWNWNAGGATVTNNDGSISTQVRANTTAGISIVSYTGNNASATIGHGLGVAPEVVIVKRRDDAGDWIVGHDGLAENAFANNKFLKLEATNSVFTNGLVWGSQPTSSVVQLVTGSGANNLNGSSMSYIAYCFSEVAGYSKFGSFSGNANADGTFVYTGFRPAWTMIKSTDATYNWVIQDTERFGGINSEASDKNLAANSNSEEPSSASFSGNQIDYLSNGFKLRSTAANTNGSNEYIYMAFAESPFKYSQAR